MLTLLNPLTLVLGTLCMTWVGIASLGAFSIKLPYAALLLVVLYACTGPRKIAASLVIMRRNAFWLLPCALYFAIVAISQAGSPNATSAPRQLFYISGFVALAGSLAASPKLGRTFRVGAALGLATFVVAVEILARQVGLSWGRAVAEFAQGNLKFVVYSFFREVFNAVDPLGDPLGASTKNEVAVGVLILALLFRSASAKASRDIPGLLFMGLALGLLLLLNTRSVLIAAGVSILMAMALGAAAQPQRNLPALLFKGVAAVALVVLAVGASLQDHAVTGTIGGRFAFDDNSTAARMQQYREALAHIELHPFAGNGYFEIDGHPIHNLFLFAWADAGLVAFLLTVIFYVGLVGCWASFLLRAVKRPETWVVPIAVEWIAPLPITPLLRVWQSGDGGNMYLGEWVAVSCFFGCWLANDLRLRAATAAALNAHQMRGPGPRAARAHARALYQ